MPYVGSLCVTSFFSFNFLCYNCSPEKWHVLALKSPRLPSFGPTRMRKGLEKVPISPWLATLLHICGVIPTSQSPVTPRDRQRLRIEWRRHCIECRYRRIKWPPCDRHAKRRRLRIERRYHRIKWRVFHDISQWFKSVSWCFISGSWCITMFYMCFIMFYYVLWCLASRATIVIIASASSWSSSSSSWSGSTTTPQSIGDNSAEIGDDAAARMENWNQDVPER